MELRRGRERGADFWSPRKAAWYARAVRAGDYAERVLAAAADALDGCRSALDVGAGVGALTLPLARRLCRVTALEPAPAMAAELRAAVAAERLDSVTVVEAAWGEVEVAPHDLVLCAHVGGLLRPGAPFLGQVSTVARRSVVLVRDVPTGDDKFFYAELYPRLRGRPYHRGDAGDTAADTVRALRALGIEPRVTEIEYSSDQPFDSLEEACDFWMAYMELEDDGARAVLRDFLRRRLEPRDDGWLARLRKRAAVIAWTVA
jgi:SAM-dependent methyltransferase